MSTGPASTSVAAVMAAIERLAPPALAQADDNVGLQLGRREAPAERILVALEVTPEVAQEALEWSAELLVLHHPAIYRPLRTLAEPTGAAAELLRLATHNVAVYVAHTNLDAAPQIGTGEALAEKLGLLDPEPLVPMDPGQQRCKVVAFVPREHVAEVRSAMAAAGAGVIGLYSECSFELEGRGGFVPGRGAAPYVGEVGEREEIVEVRLEMVAPLGRASEVVNALVAAHPYEEPACEVYPLLDFPAGAGMGRLGRLATPLSLRELASHCAECLGVDGVRFCGAAETVIRTVAVCGGSGASLLETVVGRADAFVTGDVKHHEAHEARALGVAVVDATHWATEWPVVAKLAGYLRQACPECQIAESRVTTLPWRLC